VGRYLRRDNLRYARVYSSTSDYLPSTGFFLVPLPNEQTDDAARAFDAPFLNTTAMKWDVAYPGPVFVHLNDGPQRRQQQAWVLGTRVLVSSTLSTSCQSVFAPTRGAAYSQETKSVVLTAAIRHSEYSIITREQTPTKFIQVPLVQRTHSSIVMVESSQL